MKRLDMFFIDLSFFVHFPDKLWGYTKDSQMVIARSFITFILIIISNPLSFGEVPNEVFVYENSTDGFQNQFVIGSGSEISGAHFKLNSKNSLKLAKLTYKGYREFSSESKETRKIIKGWLYEGSDNSDRTWQIFFASETLKSSDLYPIFFYTCSDHKEQFTIWRTADGARRRKASLEDKLAAILYSEQINSEIFPINQFKIDEIDPLYPQIAWDKIRSSVEKLFIRELSLEDNFHLPLLLMQLENEHYRIVFPTKRQPNLPLEKQLRINKALKSVLNITDSAFIQAVQATLQVRLTSGKFKARFKPNGVVNLTIVGDGFAEIFQSDTNIFTPLELSVQIRDQRKGRVTVISKPWQRLHYPQDWRLACKADPLWRGNGTHLGLG